MLQVVSTGGWQIAAAASVQSFVRLSKCRAQNNSKFPLLLEVFLMLGLSEHIKLG